MSLSVTNSERSDQDEPASTAGLRSPLYGTATFTTLSPTHSSAPLSSGASESRLSYPSRSVASTSDDGTRLRPASSYDSASDPDFYDNDDSIDDTAEVEEVLSRDEEGSSGGDNYTTAHSASELSSSSGSGFISATGSYASGSDRLDYDRERRTLSALSERAETQSISSGVSTGAGIFQNIFASTFQRPTSLFTRSFYGGTASSTTSSSSPLSPPNLSTLHGSRPSTPDRTFRPAPPTGRRVGNLIASFESSNSDSEYQGSGHARLASAPMGPRSPSPYSASSRSSSPIKHSRFGSTGFSVTERISSPSMSSLLSPTERATAYSRTSATRSTETGTITERPRSPLHSVRNIVAAWREQSPEKASTVGTSSVVKGPSITNTSASSTRIDFGDGIFSLRRRAGLTSATSASGDGRSEFSSSFGGARSGVSGSSGLARTSSQRSAGGSSVFDMSELGSFIRENQDPLRVGQLWYLNVHAPPPFRWQRCRAMLYPNILLLTWLAPGGGRGVVTLDLVNCNEVRSVPSPSHPTARDDIGTIAARLQMDGPDTTELGDYDLLEMLCPFQLLYNDGIERLGAESARERVRWVSAIWEALDRSMGPPDRSMTRSPTGSIRTIRSGISATSSGSGSGSASTSYLPPSETIPDLPDFDSLSQSESSRQTLSSLTSYARTRATDDGAISSRGGFLHPYSASIEIAPSRSSSLRRTSSLADLDAEFASALSASGIQPAARSRARGVSARWTQDPSEYSSSLSGSSGTGQVRRVRASTFYSSSSASDTYGLETTSSTLAPTQGLYSTYSSDTGTEVVPSTLSLRGPSSNSMLGDSHSGPSTTMLSTTTTPTRSRTAESLSLSGTGLTRATAVRRRTPRGARSESTFSTSDKENEYDESYTVDKTSHFSTLDDYSYTTTSYDEYTRRAASESMVSTIPYRPPPQKAESESEDDTFHTPTPASRNGTQYLSAPGTPTPSMPPSLPSTEYDTAIGKASSTAFMTADVCSSDMDVMSTAYTTAQVCPSSPPKTETEYITAMCHCKPAEPSIPEEISDLTPSLSLPKSVSIKEAEIPLPESETEESPSYIMKDLSPPPFAEPSLTPSTVTTLPELAKQVHVPTPSLTESSTFESTTSVTLSSISEVQPTPSTPTSVSIPALPESPSTPSSPSSIGGPIKSVTSISPKSKSLYVPSHSSVKSDHSISEYDSTFLAPSPSLHSIPFADPIDESFETSFLRPGLSEVYSMMSSPFFPKNFPDLSTTASPSLVSVATTSSMESLPRLPEKPVTPEKLLTPVKTPTPIKSITPEKIEKPSPIILQTIEKERELTEPEPSTPSSVSTPTGLSFTSEESSLEISSLTPSSVIYPEVEAPPSTRTITPSTLSAFSGLRSRSESVMSSVGGRTATPSSLAPSSALRSGTPSVVAQSLAPSSLTASSPFGDDTILGHGVTVERTLSTLSTVSAVSYDSAIFAPSVAGDEHVMTPSTLPKLLSSRTSTPRPATPSGVPLPSSPSTVSISSATPTARSISTPPSEPSSMRTMTSVVTEDVDEKPREEILTHDVNRLLRYLHDLDQIRGGETQDMKEQLHRIEDELRDLSDYLHRPATPKRVVEYVPVPTPISVATPKAEVRRTPRPQQTRPEHVLRDVPSDSLTYTSVPSVQRDLPSESTAPLPVPEPQARDQTPTPVQAPAQPRSVSPTYSPSEISEGLSFLSSHHSDDFSLMSLGDYPAIPVSPPGSPSSPSSMGWSSPSSRPTLPPSSRTPSSEERSTVMGLSDHFGEPVDLTLESPLVRLRTPLPAASPLASLATAESPLQLPPGSMTPSAPEEAPAIFPRDMSPLSENMPTPTPVEYGDLSSATDPPLSQTPTSSDATSSILPASDRSISERPISERPASARSALPALPARQPASPVLSLSTEPSEHVPSPSASPAASPMPFPEPSVVPSPMPLLTDVPSSPAITVRPTTPADEAQRNLALDNLRDLLEDLRGQTQALWDGQLSTNRMLDDLIDRGQPQAPAPPQNEEVLGRLRNIEGLLNGLLRDLDRARMGFAGPEDTAPSDISSDTSSALRRYIERLRRPMPQDLLHMPTPVRAPRPDLDSEWLDFISQPPVPSDQPIQGPPPLVPLVQRLPRHRRAESTSPPPSIPTPVLRTSSVPLEESIRLADEPTYYPRRPPWMRPRAGLGVRRPLRPQESQAYLPVRGRPGSEFRPEYPRPERPPALVARVPPTAPSEGPDFDAEVRNRRRRARGGDGWVDLSDRPIEETIPWEDVPPPPTQQPPRSQTAPPTPSWYAGRPDESDRRRPQQTLGNVGTVPSATARPTQQVPAAGQAGAAPGAAAPAVSFIPAGMPITGPPPPFNEMLDLLRQNRLAQTASIDQQREIMRYMRGLNHWLELDVRDRQNEMRSIGARVDALRGELSQLGAMRPGVAAPPVIPGAPPVQQGPTYIVPPMPQPAPGFAMSPPVGPPVVPMGPMPQPGVPFSSQFGPPVVPPMVPPEGFETATGSFIPPRPMADVPVVPSGPVFPRPPSRYERSYTDSMDDRSPEHPIFIPPHPSQVPGTPMVPVPPPPMGYPPIQVVPPHPSHGVIDVEESGSRTPSDDSRSRRSHTPPDIHIHVPSAPGSGIPMAPSAPPDVYNMGPPGGGPIYPGGPMVSPQPTMLPTVPPGGGQPIIIAPPPPTVPSVLPGEHLIHSPPPSAPIIIQTSPRPPEMPSEVIRLPPHSEGPARIVPGPEYDRGRSPSHHRRPSYSPHDYGSRSPSRRSHRHPRGRHDSRSRSYSPGRDRDGRRRGRDYDDRDEGGRGRRSRSRSRSRSRTPSPTIVHVGPPLSGLPPPSHGEMYPPPPTGPPVIITAPGPSDVSHALPVGPPGAVPPPVIVAPPLTQPYPVPPSMPPVGYERSRSQTPPPLAPTQPIIIHSEAPRTRHSRSRSRSRSPERRHPRHSDADPHDRRSSRSPESERRHGRSHRPRHSSDDYTEGDPHGPRRGRRRRSREYSPSRGYEPTELPLTPSVHHRPYDDGFPPSHAPSRMTSRRSRSPRPVYVEGDERDGQPRTYAPRTGTARSPPSSPTRVLIHTRPDTSPPPVIIRPPPSHAQPTPSVVYGPLSEVARVPPSPVHVVRPPPSHEEMLSTGRVPTRVPSRRSDHAPTVVHITPGRGESELYGEEPHPIHPSHPSEYAGPPVSEGHPIPPPQSDAERLRSEILGATDTQPIIPVVSSEAALPTRTHSHRIPPEPVYEHEEGHGTVHIPVAMEEVPAVERIRTAPERPLSPTRVYAAPPRVSSGPGDLELQDALHAHQERLEEQERRLTELEQAALEAEDRREQFFREHEEERQRIFQDNEERREHEIVEFQDRVRDEVQEEVHKEVEEVLREQPALVRPPFVPPIEDVPEGITPVPPPGGAVPVTEGEPSFLDVGGGGPPTLAQSEEFSLAPSEGAIPIPPPVTSVVAEPLPQLQEILDLLRAQQEESIEQKAAEAARFDVLREEIDRAREDARQECEERIRMLEEELARTKDELELERNQRRQEELERIEQERAETLERDEAIRNQLSDITNIVQENREDIINKRNLMDERWTDKERRREGKQAFNDNMFGMLQRIIEEREQERIEREHEREVAAGRPTIEHVLEELNRQNENQIRLINELRDTWRDDSARQHQDTLEAVRATAQEMVPYNLTGYLDEFSRALAGEIRTLLGEVGHLHEQKRTIQFEISSLLHMHSQYGPGGQFEPEWIPPAAGPLAPGPPPPDVPPPPPEEPAQPPPSRPAWRTVQQRMPRRRRTQRGQEPPPPPPPQQEPPPALAPPPRMASWATWQPNLANEPSPPPVRTSPLVVPPQAPSGLFGPRSPRSTQYGH